MEIKKIGHSSFFIKTKQGTVVTDPFLIEGIGYPKNITADIVTVSHGHSDHNNIAAIGGEPLVIEYAGEYEKQGIRIDGFKTYHDAKQGVERGGNIIFKITVEGVRILHLGDLGHSLSNDILEEIGDIDIVLVPVGGFYTIDANTASSIVKDIEPSIVIPMHYLEETMIGNNVFEGKIASVQDFLTKMGAANIQKSEKLVITKEMLNASMQVIVL